MKTPASFHPSTILCPVDFSELSDLALRYAAAGARFYAAQLVVFHAARLEVPAYFTPAQSSMLSREHRAARGKLMEFLGQHVSVLLGTDAKSLRIRFDSAEAHPAEAIPAAAAAHGADLIVMGTHGRSGARRLWLGSVTEQVVHESRIPVFVVRQKQHPLLRTGSRQPKVVVNKIVCPLDENAPSRSLLQHADSIARRFHSQLIVLRILEGAGKPRREAARRELERWLEEAGVVDVELRLLGGKGSPAEQILAEAASARADLVVLGAQRHESLRTWLAGGDTDVILRRAPAPVLVVPN